MRKWVKGAAAACSLLGGLWASQAIAVNPEGHDIPYFAAQYAKESADDSRLSDGGDGYQLTFGVPLSWDKTAFELTFYDAGRNRDLDNKKDYQTVLMLNLVRDLGLFGWDSETSWLPRFKPFGLVGLGAVEDDVLGDKHLHVGVDLGLGLLFPTSFHGWAVRTEARVQTHENDKSVPGQDNLVDYRVMVGLQVPLTVFYDRGGVKPARDCDLAVVDIDSGRKDCAADSDRDGVADTVDECPGTPPGTIVDRRGCELTEGFVLKGVKFHTDSAQLTEGSKSILNDVAASLNSAGNEGITVEIGGHTDNQGSDAYNLMLSQQRAESVRQYLIRKGVDASRMKPEGFGEGEPVTDNNSEKGRAKNRRVEFRIVAE